MFAMDCDDVQKVLSQRVVGAAYSMFLSKRKLVQAPPPTVEAVRLREDLLG